MIDIITPINTLSNDHRSGAKETK